MSRNKIITVVFSILIAVGLWAYVMWDTDPVVTQTIPSVHVQVLNAGSLEQRGLTILGEEEYTVDIRVSGKKRDIAAMNVSDISVTADVGGYGAGEAVIPVTINTLDTLNVIDVRPSKLTITIDSVVHVEKPVRLNVEGEVPPDVEIGKISINDAGILVNGASTYVEEVAFVRATVNVADMADTQTLTKVALEALNADGNPVGNVTVTPQDMETYTILYYTKEVPLEVSTEGDLGMLVEGEILSVGAISVPETIKIRGAKAAVDSVQLINGTVDVSGMTESGTLDIKFDFPEEISLAGGVLTMSADVTITGHEEESEQGEDTGGESAEDPENE